MIRNVKYKNLRENMYTYGPDDGSVELKRYSVDPLINHSFLLDRCYQFFYTHIYILDDCVPLMTLQVIDFKSSWLDYSRFYIHSEITAILFYVKTFIWISFIACVCIYIYIY